MKRERSACHSEVYAVVTVDHGHCSCCSVFDESEWIDLRMPKSARPKEFVRLCAKCLRAFAGAKVIGKEVRRRLNGCKLVLKRFRPRSGTDTCIVSGARVVARDAVAVWRDGKVVVLCVACLGAAERASRALEAIHRPAREGT